MALFQPTTD